MQVFLHEPKVCQLQDHIDDSWQGLFQWFSIQKAGIQPFGYQNTAFFQLQIVEYPGYREASLLQAFQQGFFPAGQYCRAKKQLYKDLLAIPEGMARNAFAWQVP